MKRPVFFLLLLVLTISNGCSSNRDPQQFMKYGMEQLNKNNIKAAYKWFKKAAEIEPSNASYHWAAMQVAPNQNQAYIHAKAAWDNGFRTQASLLALTKYSFHTSLDQKFQYAMKLYNELPDSEQTEEFRGDIFFYFDRIDSSLTLWTIAFNIKPSPSLCSKIAAAFNQKAAIDDAKAILCKCRGINALDYNGYIMLFTIRALEYNYSEAEKILQEAISKGQHIPVLELEKAEFYTGKGDLETAQKIATKIVDSTENAAYPHIVQGARLLLTFIFNERADTAALKSLLQKVNAAKDIFSTAERKLLESLLEKHRGNRNVEEKITVACRALQKNSFAHLIFARHLAEQKKYLQAAESYRQIKTSLLFSPYLIVEYAAVLSRAGKDDDALMVISSMHQHKAFTRASLELYRDLTYKKNLLDQSMEAQKLLELKYPDDIKIRFNRGFLALKAGKTDSAISIFSQLAAQFPQEPQFELARLSVFMIEENYEKAIQECKKSKAPLHLVKVIEAKALRKLNRNSEALQAYAEALASKSSTATMMEYADLLVFEKRYEEAEQLYNKIIETDANALEKDSISTAIILNNLAWTQLQRGQTDLKKVIATAKKAHELLPEHLHILDTYAEVLLKAEKYDECIKVLKKSNRLNKEPKLLINMANAYEKKGQIANALRCYNEALTIADSSYTLKDSIDFISIKKHVNGLTNLKR